MTNLTQRFATGDESSSGVTGMLKVNSVLQQRYMVSGILGSGGMGAVYLARDLRFPNVVRNVAVKEVINTQGDMAARELILKNFSREADVLAALSHTAIPKIYDYFASADRAYLVMEYIDGRDLEALINQTPDFLPTEQIRRWAVDLCDVLDYLHTHKPDPIIFRDMKPSNIMIDKSGEVRLIDFGIAKWFLRSQAQRGTMIGTEGYAPTEQYRGESSPLSDLYALGATLHHILTKRDPRLEPPFTFHERPIRVINSTVSAEFDAVIMKALSLDKNDRYQSAADMKAALTALGRPTPAVRYSATPNVSHVDDEKDEAEEQPSLQLVWKFKVEDEIRSSPVHHGGAVYFGAYDNNLWGLDAKTGHQRLKYATKDGIAATPAVSTEESLLIFGSEDQTVYALDLRTQKVSWTFPTEGPVRGTATVAHNHAFIGSDDHFLYALKLNNGRRDWRFDAGSPIRSRPAISDDRIVFGTEDGEVFGLDLQSVIKWRFKTKRAVTSSPLIVDNIAYFGSMDGQVYAIDAANGWGVWRFRTGKPVVSSPLIIDKTLFIGSADGFLYALDLNGHEVWRFKTNGQIVSSPKAHNGALYFGCTDHKVYCVDLKRGALRWEFGTEGAITSTACIVNDTVYIGSFDHQLYAFNA